MASSMVRICHAFIVLLLVNVAMSELDGVEHGLMYHVCKCLPMKCGSTQKTPGGLARNNLIQVMIDATTESYHNCRNMSIKDSIHA